MLVDWGADTPTIAHQIHIEKPWYAVKLMHAFGVPEGDYLSDWYLHLHGAVECIKANSQYRKTPSTACIFAYRKLANFYRDTYTRLKRQDPQKLWELAQDGCDSAAVLYTTTLINLYDEDEDEGEGYPN